MGQSYKDKVIVIDQDTFMHKCGEECAELISAVASHSPQVIAMFMLFCAKLTYRLFDKDEVESNV